MVRSTATESRFVDLQGCFNFRDLGGYRGDGGRTVRWRRLFRADGLHHLTDEDRRDLGDLGLRTVIDLRSGDELTERGRIAWPAPGLAYHHLPMFDVLPDREEFPTWVDSAYVAHRYAEILEHGSKAVTATLRLVSDPATYPVVIHCAAGKDRTGIVSAVLLGLLGVPDKDIVADYALSGGAMARFLAWLRAEYPDAKDELERSSAAIVAAEPETMALFLQRFRSVHGSFEDYAESLGMISAATALRAALLEA
jgi:protein tyrosine/serine phosphatase